MSEEKKFSGNFGSTPYSELKEDYELVNKQGRASYATVRGAVNDWVNSDRRDRYNFDGDASLRTKVAFLGDARRMLSDKEYLTSRDNPLSEDSDGSINPNMKYSEVANKVIDAINGAKVLAGMGKGYKASRSLQEIFVKLQEINPEATERYKEEVEEFLKHNPIKNPTGLVKKLIPVFCVLSGASFLSPNFTGNAIVNSSNQATSFLGISLLISGLVFGLFLIKNKK